MTTQYAAGTAVHLCKLLVLMPGCDFPCLTGEETEAQRGGAARQVAVQ